MYFIKIIGVYILGHLLCVTASRDGIFYDADYSVPWLLLSLPSSYITHGHILAVRVACCVNIGAVLIILYLLICAVAGISPIEYSELYYLYVLWFFSAFSVEFFREQLYLSKRETARLLKFASYCLTGVGLLVSIVTIVLFVSHTAMLIIRSI